MLGTIRSVVFITLVLAGVSVTAVAWPYFSDSPRPQALDVINRLVQPTPLGQQVTNVLGAQDVRGSMTPDRVQHSVTQFLSNLLEKQAARAKNEWLIRQIEVSFPGMTVDQQDKLLRILESELSREASASGR